MSKQFSVLMTVYAKEKPENLNAALESIWDSQLLKPNEIVLVLDGPVGDNLEKIVSNWASRTDLSLKLVRLATNMGLPTALNFGLDACSYNLVARMDSDDICRADRFVKQISHMDKNPNITISGSWIKEFSVDVNDSGKTRIVPSKTTDVEKFAKTRCPLNHMTVMYRKNAIIDNGGYKNLASSEDYHLWGRMLAKGYNIDNIPEVLVYARADHSFQSRRGGTKFINIEYVIFKDFYRIDFLKLHEAFVTFVARISVRLTPNILRSFIYSKLFRKC